MKKEEVNFIVSLCRRNSIRVLIGVGFLYILLVSLEIPFVFRTGFNALASEDLGGFIGGEVSGQRLESEENLDLKKAPIRPAKNPFRDSQASSQPTGSQSLNHRVLSGLVLDSRSSETDSEDSLLKTANVAWELGRKFWEELESRKHQIGNSIRRAENRSEECPNSISLSGYEFVHKGKVMVLPCGLTLGSHITIVGKPRAAHSEDDPRISLLKDEDESIMVSQFMMELQGLKTVDGEDPPRILHFNPRLRGDWSGKPVIEMNTCYRMQWGSAQRCEGWGSRAEEETVDGHTKCEKWIGDHSGHFEKSKTSWWLNRLIGRRTKVTVNWPYPFAEGKLFVMTLSAGLEGYHVYVDGRHITSFPYRTGFVLEDATGLFLNGDIDVHSVFAASLPASHPSFSPQRQLEMSNRWKAPPLPKVAVEMFIGILSAGNHFAERMAVRKSWMQHKLVKSSNVVARFFVALHSRKEINVELRKEADFFGDIVIVPYMDNYDLVVLKTIAICEYGVHSVYAKYIMKADDDTFIRLDAVMEEARKVPDGRSIYIGNINYYHKPLRDGKWAVRFEEWPEEDYPPYANGPGYILSYDVANFVVSEFERGKLRLFKMEDVSMGMWVEKFNSSKPVEYVHSEKFCQFGCIEGYFTAHYQSPRQMICLWNKLQQLGKPQCCNMR